MSDWVHVEFDAILAETDKAILVEIDGDQHWLPLTQIENAGADYRKGDKNGSMCITKWIAKQKGLV